MESEIKRLSSQANQLRKEFRDKEFELKRIKEITKQLQICINKKVHYDGYRKDPNDKIYMMMNRKDVEAYKVAFSEVEIFIKQFPHLKKEIMEGLKRGDGKSIFKNLNQHSKSLHDIQKELAEEHDKLREKRSELEQLKANIDQYLGRNKELSFAKYMPEVSIANLLIHCYSSGSVIESGWRYPRRIPWLRMHIWFLMKEPL